jgi:EAL domain-containing protein (putative c-di-GMP-specific phosphodiesterase class I)
VIVGVDKCEKDASITKLRYAEADAAAVYEALTDRKTGTFADNAVLLTGREATADAVSEALRRAVVDADPGDVLLAFFAGHGYVAQSGLQRDVYLVTSDFDSSQLLLRPESALRMQFLRRYVFEASGASTFLLLDCCYAGEYAAAKSGRAASEALLRALESHETQLSQHTALMACPADQKTRESSQSGHGVFTEALLRGLSGAAAGPDGGVTFADLANFVKQQPALPKVGLFAQDWGPTTRLTNPRNGAGQTAAIQAPQAKLVLATSPMEPYVPEIRQLLDHMFRDRHAAARLRLNPLDRIVSLLEADFAATVQFDLDGSNVIESSDNSTKSDLDELIAAVKPRITRFGRNVLGHLILEESGRQSLAVPLTRDTGAGISILIIANVPRKLLAMGELLAETMRFYLKAEADDPVLGELKVVTALRRTFGRMPLAVYNDALDVYGNALDSVCIFFEPVVALNESERGIGVHSYEALARGSTTATRAPVDLLDISHVWGDQFTIKRDTVLAQKAIQAYADAFDRTDSTGPPRPLSINVAVRTLMNDGYVDALYESIVRKGLTDANVTLEISERDPIAPAYDERWLPDAATFFRERLASITRKTGLLFAVDDFGVAHASLDRLSVLDLAQIKVDRAILFHDRELAMEELRLVVKIAYHALQRRAAALPRPVIVEGVDDQVPLSLRDIFECGIRYVQGYITELPAGPNLVVANRDLRAKLAAMVRGER